MNPLFRGTAVAVLLFTALPAAAQTCNANIPLTKPDGRYSDNGDGTVTDTATGLMWAQCPEGMTTTVSACDTGAAATYTWQEALQRAQTVNGNGFAGHDDWRLPNLKELKSLVETACYAPAINETVFPNTPSSWFWSSSPVASGSGFAWGVYFYYGSDYWGSKGGTNYVRLVRAGQ